MKFAQILSKKVHWIFESETKPLFAPNIILKDITDRPDIQEGWDYNEETGEFTAPVISDFNPIEREPSLEEQILFENKYQTMILEMGIF